MQRVWKYFFYKLEFAEAHEGSHWREAVHLQSMWKVFCFNFKLSNTSEDTHFTGVMTFFFPSTSSPCFQLDIIVMKFVLWRYSFPKGKPDLPVSTFLYCYWFYFMSLTIVLYFAIVYSVSPLLFFSQKAFSFLFSLFTSLWWSKFLEYWCVF